MGKKVIFDAHEHTVADMLDKTYLSHVGRYVAWWVAKCLIGLADRFFDGIVTATGEIAKEFNNKNCITINNYPEWNARDLERTAKIPPGRRRPSVVYVGGISVKRGIKEIVEAVELVNQVADVTLSLAGSFDPPELEQEVRCMPGWRFVDYRGFLKRSQVAALLSEAIGGLVLLHPTRNYIRSNPIKLYEYLAWGLPVIISDFPTWRAVLGSLNVALFVDPNDPQMLANNIMWILKHRDLAAEMGGRGRAAVSSQFNWSHEKNKLLRLYEAI